MSEHRQEIRRCGVALDETRTTKAETILRVCADGETSVSIGESVREEDVYIIQVKEPEHLLQTSKAHIRSRLASILILYQTLARPPMARNIHPTRTRTSKSRSSYSYPAES